MRSFENWRTQELEETFGIKRIFDSPLLTTWLNATYDFSEREIEDINDLAWDLFRRVEYWNEDELKFQFIAPFVRLVDFNEVEGVSLFTQRFIKAKVNQVELGGVVDFVVAKGYEMPKPPYFFIHEYKQETRHSTSPSGQLLSEMIAAYSLNQNNLPVLGCFVTGRLWFFVVFDENKYALSDGLRATDPKEAKQIVAMLHFAKYFIADAVRNLTPA
ncbi:MAG: hypothetical protein MUE30_16760 [Spirosomaceae bacterium]|jgi:hypothetical protein|nr:hypothetical protein [Spirosomataceae bacterium]